MIKDVQVNEVVDNFNIYIDDLAIADFNRISVKRFQVKIFDLNIVILNVVDVKALFDVIVVSNLKV